MQLSPKDREEMRRMAALIARMDDTDAATTNGLSAEIYQKQPFFLSVLFAHHLEVSKDELDEIIKIYFLIWDYFKPARKILRTPVTDDQYKKALENNVHMFQYAAEEPENIQTNIYANDIQNLQSKALWTGVLFIRYTHRPVLMNMEKTKIHNSMITIKCFIECFEAL